jgi:SnoaL-like domain
MPAIPPAFVAWNPALKHAIGASSLPGKRWCSSDVIQEFGYHARMNENDQSRITELVNKSEITTVVNRYFRALDEKNFDARHFASILTPRAKMTRPNGASLTGPDEISASHEKSFARFEGSQHLVGGHDISIDANTAIVRANLVAMHMWQGSNTNANKAENFFVAGGVVRAELVQTDGQWKISQLRTDVVWRAGGFKDMMQTGR